MPPWYSALYDGRRHSAAARLTALGAPLQRATKHGLHLARVAIDSKHEHAHGRMPGRSRPHTASHTRLHLTPRSVMLICTLCPVTQRASSWLLLALATPPQGTSTSASRPSWCGGGGASRPLRLPLRLPLTSCARLARQCACGPPCARARKQATRARRP